MSRGKVTRRALHAAVLGLSLLGAAGCGCGKERDTIVVYDGGVTAGDEYQSSPPEGPWLHFPGGRRYRLMHYLGVTPTLYESFLAFEEQFEGGPPREYTIGSGDAARFRDVNAEYLEIENDTCASYYVRVVAHAPGAASAPDGEGGAAPTSDATSADRP